MSKLGGYQIIDLRNIGLTLGASQKSITDAEILAQLRTIRNYIEKGHDYSKALNNSPKPVLIRYRDAKNNEKLEACAFASIISSNSSLTYVIKAKGLEIEVVFEEKTDDDGNKYYDIKTAKYLYSEDESVEGDLNVEGDVEIGGDLTVTGAINGEETPSVKPIYYHPININSETGENQNESRLQLVILDNQSSAYYKQTLIAKLTALMDLGALINCNGYIKVSGVLYPAYMMLKSGDAYRVYYHTTSDRGNVELSAILGDNATVQDGVNKIN